MTNREGIMNGKYRILAAATFARHPAGICTAQQDEIGRAHTADQARELALAAEKAGEARVEIYYGYQSVGR